MTAFANYATTPVATTIINPDTGFHIKHNAAGNMTYVHSATGAQVLSFTDTGGVWFAAAKALATAV